MFVETKKQEGTDNPIKGFVSEDKIKYLPELDLICSILGLVLLLIATITGIDFKNLEYFISTFFIFDFIFRLFKAESKLSYLKKNWYNLALSLPIYPITWMVVSLTLRMLLGVLQYTLAKIDAAFTSMMILGASLVTFSSISILQFETVENSNIKTIWDAIWWSICTITTVGYGDKFPVTEGGKIVAVILMVCGIGLFGTLIGYFSSFFTDKEKKNNATVDTIEELSAQITELHNELKNKS